MLAVENTTVSISTKDNRCDPIASFELFLTDLINASAQPFCQGASGAENSHAKACTSQNSVIRFSSINSMTSFILQSADLSWEPLSDQILTGHPLSEINL